MLIAILVVNSFILGVLVYMAWPKKVKTGGWVAPSAEPIFDESDDNVIPITDDYENQYREEHNIPEED